MSAVTSTDPAINGMVLSRSQTLCRYYVRGICRFGELCRFSHDLTLGRPECEQQVTTEVPPKPSTSSHSASTSTSSQQRNWANAPVFVPSQKRNPAQEHREDEATVCSELERWEQPEAPYAVFQPGASWAEVVGGPSSVNKKGDYSDMNPASLEEVCPNESPCVWGEHCPYRIHMELCEMCDQHCLHPTDQAQRKKHNRECLQQHEQAMELSFAIARSKDKTCGICFDTIMEKAGREKRFGILPNCNHIFCLECIRTWRQAKQFEHKITRACPECRVCSDFVCPSAFWVETKEEKDKLLNDYRAALEAKDCKYFKKGEGKCPFGNKCFYKHALPNGDIVDVGLPKRTRKLQSQNEIIDLLDIYLWDYVDQRNYHWLEILSSEISESSDYSDED
ncbi:probable E3 ubiquitin-protein ligase makorin-1 [Drosophila ficusphila]|uniref:probable E3 ubiquitin-protein ligase makorin-1 n=1 Tax=Drosophila ficusphila TaxID=30025 RepID=UPI0007E6CD7A|nr:probable E3 ubiquitin-protein ligase makorin-1 [Drosophila ficusphila]XP_017042419.1 probable E3 ubiquitin-protein ligase makorin-1 [Drosophila ficusphila]